MAKQVTLTIDGKQVTVPDGMLVVDAAKVAGIDVPVFCYHPKMEPVGMCRMCLVEIGRPGWIVTPASPVLDDKGEPNFNSCQARNGLYQSCFGWHGCLHSVRESQSWDKRAPLNFC